MQTSDHATRYEEPQFVAQSSEMLRLLDLVTRAAGSEATVLIQGETGTGKELIARTLHRKSPRRDGPFVAINCGAYTDSLLASELFGHKRGAYTGAVSDRAGIFEAAARGTVFLDEIGSMSPTMQIKVLRVLQERVITRVGASEEKSVDVRVVAATNADLAELVRSKEFREDLYYRVKVIACRIPPLRQRRDDIKPLMEHFLAFFSRANERQDISLAPSAERILLDYSWPGNVRQLRAEIEQAVAMADSGAVIEPEHLSEELRFDNAAQSPLPPRSDAGVALDGQPASPNPSAATYKELLDAWTRDVVAERLASCGDNITKTAQSLDISRSTLYALLKKYGMHGKDA